ncbi:hypothetical protein [uncultured Flavobacterium sp.]|uniref:hypothetical protein n=1 Tax=uncultured Flavobacterium sp. TaxID=165435 RepID=UPI0030ECC1C4|tara:strand:- start:632 stop:1180 length:549 start_codon:yes stop_codon:yes gene_type:complete
MLKYPNLKTATYAIAFILILFLSCKDKKEETYSDGVFNKENVAVESEINFSSVAVLNENNKKIIDIASIAFNNSRELKESLVILKIKKDHQKIESELKKITNENLIIIPEPIFDLNLNENFLKGINSSYYIISLLEKEINNQIKLLDSIEKISQDVQFKSFAYKSKEVLIDNNDSLEQLLEL